MPTPATELELAARVEQVRQDPSRRQELVALLHESSTLYDGRGSAATARMRGWVLAAFEEVGLPPAAVPHVIAELESGREPYLIAAAAKAVRGWDGAESIAARALVTALHNVRFCDDAVTFDELQPIWPPRNTTTAITEILVTLRGLGGTASAVRPDLEALRWNVAEAWSDGARHSLDETLSALEPVKPGDAGCCGMNAPPSSDDDVPTTELELDQVLLEDQDGNVLRGTDCFAGPLTVLAFFYTRCTNPNKCSLTITKLAALQRALGNEGLEAVIGIVAISYDPGYDDPARLRAYGRQRGIRFGDGARMLRAIENHGVLRAQFRLRVGYNGSIVNQHAIELFAVNDRGRVVRTWSRTQWDPGQVLDELSRLAADPPSEPVSVSRGLRSPRVGW